MHIRLTRLALGATMALSLMGAASFAQASSLSSTQVSAILSLLQSFGATQDVINNVNQALGGSGTAGTNQQCVNLSTTLTLGSTGNDVTNLQNYLITKGYLTGTTATGYYGFLTAQAVGKLQIDLGILSSASDPSYGIMGPRTRASIGCGTQPISTSVPVQLNVTAQPSGNSSWITVSIVGKPINTQVSQWKLAISCSETITMPDPKSGTEDCGQTFSQPTSNMANPAADYVWLTAGATNQGKGGIVTFALSAYDASGNNIGGDKEQVSVGQTSNTPIATIDQGTLSISQSSITTGVGNLSIGGTVSNATALTIVLMSGSATNPPSGNKVLTVGTNVTNGKWSLSLYQEPVSAGNYGVYVYDNTADQYVGTLLTTGTLTVTASTNTSATLSLTGPSNGASIALGNTIPITYSYSNVPTNSQVVLTLSGVNTASVSGVAGGTWESPQISGSGTGSDSWMTGALGSGYTNVTGTYSITAKIRQCDPAGCQYHYSSDDSLPAYATASPIQITLVGSTAGAPTATIDQGSLTVTKDSSGNYHGIVTGTATNVNRIFFDLPTNSGGAYCADPSTCSRSIGSDGRWSIDISGGYGAGGINAIEIYNYSTSSVGALLVKGTLMVNANTTSAPTGTLDVYHNYDTGTNWTMYQPGVTQAKALTICQNTDANNPWAVRCTWNGTEIFNDINTKLSDESVYFDGIVGTSATEVTLPYALSFCQSSSKAGATTKKCTWAGEDITSLAAANTPAPTSLSTCPANATSQRGQNGQQFECTCPSNFSAKAIWGGPTYFTDDSDICTAGAMVGQMNLISGGQLDYTVEPGQSSYTGFTQNGISSQSWTSWPGSFSITGPKACLAAGTTISMSDGSYKKIEDIKAGDRVKSRGGGKMTTSVVANSIQREDPILTINGTLKVAPDEIVYLANGTTETADHLKIDDQLLSENGRTATVVTITSSSALTKTYDLALENGNDFFADGYLVQALNPSLH